MKSQHKFGLRFLAALFIIAALTCAYLCIWTDYGSEFFHSAMISLMTGIVLLAGAEF